MSYSQQNTDLIEKARQASLADFFTQNGFETERIRNELHVKGYGGLYVNTETTSGTVSRRQKSTAAGTRSTA